MGIYGDAWDNAEPGAGDAEVIPAGEYTVKCVAADVSSNDRIWSLWTVLTGPEAGTTFFGGNYGLTVKDPTKAHKVEGVFKSAMTSFGITEAFFKNATSMQDFAAALKDVEGVAKVKVRQYTKDGAVVQANDIKGFTLTARPALPIVGGVPQGVPPSVPLAVVPSAATAPAAPPIPVAAPAPAAAPAPVAAPAPAAPAPAVPAATPPVPVQLADGTWVLPEQVVAASATAHLVAAPPAPTSPMPVSTVPAAVTVDEPAF